jgi:hypothetical protein
MNRMSTAVDILAAGGGINLTISVLYARRVFK